MTDGERAVAHISALMATLQAIIHALPREVARQAADNLGRLAQRVDAVSIASSKLPDDALEEQNATMRFMLDALEQRANAST